MSSVARASPQRLPRRIAIDGPAGSGKSTIAALLAERLGYVFVDTGALYRALALVAIERGIALDDAKPLGQLAQESRIAIGPPTVRDGRTYTVLVDGRDVTNAIRDPIIDRAVPVVARHSAVRSVMVEFQRALAQRGRMIMVGRDIGTVVLTDADLKIFLTASAPERAKRRGAELAARGVIRSRAELLHEILLRDRVDTERPVAPLKAAPDAVIVETDGLSVGQAMERVLSVIARWQAGA